MHSQVASIAAIRAKIRPKNTAVLAQRFPAGGGMQKQQLYWRINILEVTGKKASASLMVTVAAVAGGKSGVFFSNANSNVRVCQNVKTCCCCCILLRLKLNFSQ